MSFHEDDGLHRKTWDDVFNDFQVSELKTKLLNIIPVSVNLKQITFVFTKFRSSSFFQVFQDKRVLVCWYLFHFWEVIKN